eukprot:CAMPEP_0170470114 /NCGR_PEP_ID=MMETSP0123-20130129/12685_1 /TAXON_ID=182087 /ORGANISM="Favella ehrenbergii, Strain Fehren 1" /LENGTH=37 /DNA_ID= /DNA_START= /DNA_END= /DNA_ORIENTATION=
MPALKDFLARASSDEEALLKEGPESSAAEIQSVLGGS